MFFVWFCFFLFLQSSSLLFQEASQRNNKQNNRQPWPQRTPTRQVEGQIGARRASGLDGPENTLHRPQTGVSVSAQRRRVTSADPLSGRREMRLFISHHLLHLNTPHTHTHTPLIPFSLIFHPLKCTFNTEERRQRHGPGGALLSCPPQISLAFAKSNVAF